MTTTRIDGVFAGGGVKGIALAGAAAATMDLGYRFGRCTGTSSGALVASMVVAGYGAHDLRDAVLEIDWPSLADPVLAARVPLLGKHLALMIDKGIHRGDRLERTWRALLRHKGVYSFGDLGEGRLRVVATDVTHQRGLILPDDLGRYGVDPVRFPVARAVRMSAAVPVFFRSVKLVNLRGQDVSLIADGALTTNFPLRLVEWDEPRPVIGYRFVYDDDPHRHEVVRGPASLARAVITSAIRAAGTIANPLMERAAVVDIPVDRDPLDFRISAEEGRRLFDRGYQAAAAHLVGAHAAAFRSELG